MGMTATKDPYRPLNRLKISGNLPVIPQILVQLIDACHQPEVDLRAVSKLIEKDAAMAAKVLQLCNSAFIGARSAFVDVGQAVIYLGADTIKNLAVSVSVQQVFRRVETNGLLNIDRFWYHSYQNAILANRIAETVSYPNPSEAYLAGLLHDLGKLLLWMAFPGKSVPLLLKGIRCHNGRLAFLEQEKLQINHCDAGAWLIKEWGLPSLIGDAVRYHHHSVDEVEQGLPLTRIIFLADLISHSDNPEQECNEVADQLFRLAPGQTEQLKEGVDEQIQEVAHQLGIRIPTNTKSDLEPEPESTTIHKETSIELISRIRDITQLTGLLDNLLKARDRDQAARILEQSLKILFNQETSLLLLFDKKNDRLQGFTSPENVLFRETTSLRFSLQRHSDSLPAQALELHQILHSFMHRPDEDETLLDAQLTRVLGTEGMVIVPMHYQQQNIGLIIVGVSKSGHVNLLSHATPLQLLASQAAVSLFMHNWQEEQRQRIAGERLEAAALLARKIAHEINNPLAIVRNYLKVLDVKLKDREEIREELTILDQEFERIGRITHQLRDISTEKQFSQLEETDLNQLLKDIIHLYTAGLKSDNKITIDFYPDPENITLKTDRNGLKEIITNLLNNAIEALDGRGTIIVKTAIQKKPPAPDQVIITIRDNGPGVAENLQKNLFQAGITTKGDGHGGLGLAITTRILQHLDGSIALVPEPEGTTFSITLPVEHP